MPLNIRDLEPLERGGVENRKGVDYQDTYAAILFLDMFFDQSLLEVWIETHDDITLIWRQEKNGRFFEAAEFIQAKKRETRWTVSALCKPEKYNKYDEEDLPSGADGRDESKKSRIKKEIQHKLPSQSILEKSLANDRCEDGMAISFRVVTAGDVNDDLALLREPRNSPKRQAGQASFETLIAKVSKMVPNAMSKNGNTSTFWLTNALWEVTGSVEHLEHKLLNKIDEVAYSFGEALYPEQKKQLKNNLVRMMFLAGTAEAADRKRFNRVQALSWIEDQVNKSAHMPVQAAETSLLRDKLEKAKLGSLYQKADQVRRDFVKWRASAPYMPLPSRDLVVSEVESALNRLELNLDLGQIDGGKVFFQACLDATDRVSAKHNVSKQVTEGCMYHIAGRCGHRWLPEDTQ